MFGPRESSSFVTSAYLDCGIGGECIVRHFQVLGSRTFADARGGIVLRTVARAEIAAEFTAVFLGGDAQRYAAEVGTDAHGDQPFRLAGLGPLFQRLGITQRR